MQHNDFLTKESYNFEDLLTIVKMLRAPRGCPWDREQTHQSLRNNFIEEVYEVVDAIDNEDKDGIEEELGDVLLQVAFHSVIAKEQGSFDINSVTTRICKKLILRHPHVFGDVQANNAEEALASWDKMKMKEKSQESYTETLKAVPKAFPALMRAQKVLKRAAKSQVGADKLKLSDKPISKEDFEKEILNLINRASLSGFDAEQTLSESVDSFIKEFENAENN